MDVNFDRKKMVNLWGVRQHYNRHLQRLDNLMNSSQLGRSKSPMRVLQAMHQNHQMSSEFKQKCTQREIRREHMRFAQFVREMSLPRLQPDSKKVSPGHRKLSPISYDQLLQNLILYNKITDAESKYNKKELDRSFEKLSQIKMNIKKKMQQHTSSNFQKIFKQSFLHQSLYPDQTFTHVQKNHTRRALQQVKLRFDLLPLPQQTEVVYGLEIRTQSGKLLTQSKLIELCQLKKDVFVFKFSKVKANTLVVVLMRYKNNTGNAVGMFPINRGDHVASELKSCLGTISVQLLCYTQWNRPSKKHKKLRIIVGNGESSSDQKQNVLVSELAANTILKAQESELSSIDQQNSGDRGLSTARVATDR